MKVQSAKHDYTVKEIQGLIERWVPAKVYGGFVAKWLREEQEQGRRKRGFYARLLTPLMTIGLMIYQRLSADHSCDEAVSQYRGGQGAGTQGSESSSAYCQARERLPRSVIEDCLHYTAHQFRQELGEAALWHGRPVGLLDGSTLRLPATQGLRDHYGVSENQHGENHWPILRLVAAFHLFSGGVEGVVEGSYHTGELSMVHPLLKQFGAGWVWVGDCLFGVYRVIQIAQFYQQDVLVRLGKSQVKRFLGPQSLQSGAEREVVWYAKAGRSSEAGLPTPDVPGRLLYVRVERNGFRPMDVYLFTTLSAVHLYPTQALLDLYCRRWEVELDLRHLKTTLDMEELHAKSVEMVRKELLVGLLAYNLIRGVMALTALRAKCSTLALSFAGCLRRILHRLPDFADPSQAAPALWDDLLVRLAGCLLPIRKVARFEPRRVWGKPKVFPVIKGSRKQARLDELLKFASLNS